MFGNICWLVKEKRAGLVKWYNNGFPNRGQEFDSPIPHKIDNNILLSDKNYLKNKFAI